MLKLPLDMAYVLPLDLVEHVLVQHLGSLAAVLGLLLLLGGVLLPLVPAAARLLAVVLKLPLAAVLGLPVVLCFCCFVCLFCCLGFPRA